MFPTPMIPRAPPGMVVVPCSGPEFPFDLKATTPPAQALSIASSRASVPSTVVPKPKLIVETSTWTSERCARIQSMLAMALPLVSEEVIWKPTKAAPGATPL
jgi:hypothetical protein